MVERCGAWSARHNLGDLRSLQSWQKSKQSESSFESLRPTLLNVWKFQIDLSVGAYRDELGRPYVLTSILKAEERLVKKQKDKLGESDIGSDYFREVTYRLAVGDKLFDRPHVSVQVSSSFAFFFFHRRSSDVYIRESEKNLKFTAREKFIFIFSSLDCRASVAAAASKLQPRPSASCTKATSWFTSRTRRGLIMRRSSDCLESRRSSIATSTIAITLWIIRGW